MGAGQNMLGLPVKHRFAKHDLSRQAQRVRLSLTSTFEIRRRRRKQAQACADIVRLSASSWDDGASPVKSPPSWGRARPCDSLLFRSTRFSSLAPACSVGTRHTCPFGSETPSGRSLRGEESGEFHGF